MRQDVARVGGFTLVELLIVVAICALLLTVLFPVIAQVREKARQSACLNNQRQLVMAFLIYAQDHDGTLPDASSAWSDIAVDPAVLICPTKGHLGFNSYVYNGTLDGALLDTLANPETILATGDGKSADNIARSNNDFDPRHNGRFLASYLDGHVGVGDPMALQCVELGQTIEGCGSANFGWLKYPGEKYGIAFRAPKSGTITQITLQWKAAGAYGGGNLGTYTFELQSNGPGNFPSGQDLASTINVNPITAMDGRNEGYLHFSLSAALNAGTIYHLVISNTDPDPQTNWSSPNTMMTRIVPWDGTGNRGEVFDSGSWKPWGSMDPENVFNTTGSNFVNSAHSPTMLTWSDGSNTGDPYYSALVGQRAYFYGNNRAGEFITWNNPTATISRIGLPVGILNQPAPLYYHFDTAAGNELASGVIASAGQSSTIPTWVYANATLTLTQGQQYRLWFASPDSTADNCYYQYVPYGDNEPASWVECSWGGSASNYICDTGNGWTPMIAGDLSFSLQ